MAFTTRCMTFCWGVSGVSKAKATLTPWKLRVHLVRAASTVQGTSQSSGASGGAACAIMASARPMGTGGPLGGAPPSRCAKASKRDAPGGAGGAAAAGRGARRRRDGELLQLGREGLGRLGQPLLSL